MTDHTPTDPTTPERVLASAFDEAKRGNAGVVWWQDIIRTPSWRTLAAALTRGLAGSGDVGALRSALEVGLNRIKGECRGDFGTPSVAAIEDLADTLLAALAAVRAETLAGSGVGLTHGRHCPCTPCREENWTNPELAHCGMHGPSCPPVYDPYPTTATPTPPPTPALTAARLAWIQRGATLLEAVEWEDPTMGDEAERWVNDAHALATPEEAGR